MLSLINRFTLILVALCLMIQRSTGTERDRDTWVDGLGQKQTQTVLDSCIVHSYKSEEVERTSPLREYYSNILNKCNLDSSDLQGYYLGGIVIEESSLRGLNLSNLDLAKANLRGSILANSNLYRASFVLACLDSCDLSECKIDPTVFPNPPNESNSSCYLMHASFRKANLSGSRIYGSCWSFSNLEYATAHNANFNSCMMNGVIFNDADLNGSVMINTNLTYASFNNTDLNNVVFEPSALPDVAGIAYAKGLNNLKFRNNPKALTDLREMFRLAGFRTQEKQINASLKRANGNIFEFLFFDLTCEYGSNYVRPLLIVLTLLFCGSFIFLLALVSHEHSGIYLLTTGTRRVNCGNERFRVIELNFKVGQRVRYILRTNSANSLAVKLKQLARLIWRSYSTALFISLLSLTQFGFRDLQIRLWLRLFQPREFEIRLRGWPKSISALLSLLGFVLIALAVLSYIGAIPQY